MAKGSTTFGRRQRLLALLHDQPGIRVTDLAQVSRVSEGTIRNDLNALAKAGDLERVRGGGVPTDDHPAHSAAFAARFRVHEREKRQVAFWASELVQVRDTILLDASTSVYQMVHFLEDRRGLTIITNGIEVGRMLAQESSNTVMLLGGVLNGDGVQVTDLMSDAFQDLHVKTAFISCAGFTPEGGLTEPDIQEAQLKSRMIAVDIPIVGVTYFGVNHYQAGFMAGEALGEWINVNQAAQVDQLIVLIEPRASAFPAPPDPRSIGRPPIPPRSGAGRSANHARLWQHFRDSEKQVPKAQVYSERAPHRRPFVQ